MLLALAALTTAQDSPPNVVVIVADDLGHRDIRANNHACFYEAPSLDRLARSGMRFTDAYAANPVCSPTRYSLLTGKYPTRAGVTNWFSGRRKGRFAGAPFHERMALEERTLAEAMKAKGYATFFAGKWHLGPTEEFWPERQGFDVNRGGWRGGGPYGGKKYFSPYGNPRLDDGPDGEHLPDRLARETVEFIEARRGSPFFAYLAFYSVHTPLMAPAPLVEKYRQRAQAIPGPEFAEEEQVFPNGRARRVRILQKHAVYAGMVEAMDRAVGVVLDALDRLQLADDTVVVFTSDHGGLATSEGLPTSNLPFRGGKGWGYEGGLRVPLLVRWPGTTKPGAVSTQPVMSIDLFPTIAAICGLDTTEGALDGSSLVPALRRQALPPRDLFWHYPHYSNQGGFPGGAIRAGRWNLIERYEDGRVHLYDLATDFGERRDLAGAMPERVAALRARLHGWYDDVGAKFLEPKEPGGETPWRPGG